MINLIILFISECFNAYTGNDFLDAERKMSFFVVALVEIIIEYVKRNP